MDTDRLREALNAATNNLFMKAGGTMVDGSAEDAMELTAQANLLKQHAAAMAAGPELVEALDRLTGEVRACWGMNESEFRGRFGNTNYQAVADCLHVALAILAKATPPPKETP